MSEALSPAEKVEPVLLIKLRPQHQQSIHGPARLALGSPQRPFQMPASQFRVSLAKRPPDGAEGLLRGLRAATA